MRPGNCIVCFGNEKTLRLNGCCHQICAGCLRRYVLTALGDASMFPLKCPMHHAGCETVADAKFIQRVLINRVEFERFNKLNDRALFGEFSCDYD